jgi:hypothetical protein
VGKRLLQWRGDSSPSCGKLNRAKHGSKSAVSMAFANRVSTFGNGVRGLGSERIARAAPAIRKSTDAPSAVQPRDLVRPRTRLRLRGFVNSLTIRSGP